MLKNNDQTAHLILQLASENPQQRLEALLALREAGSLADGSLRAASLVGAQLAGSDLSGADLAGADLTGADLRGASLRGANLEGALLSGADLRGADLTGASLDGTGLADARLDGDSVLPEGTSWQPADGDGSGALLADAADAALARAGGRPPEQAAAAELTAADDVAGVPPAVKKAGDGEKGAHKSTRRQIRGSSLLLFGRFISMGVNFLVQVLTVRYLAKEDYGAFAYALSMVHLGETIITLGLDRAVTRFVPIYQEKEDYPRLFGTLLMVYGTIIGLGVILVLVVVSAQDMISGTLIRDERAVQMLVILVALAPVQAIDNVFNGTFAVFSRPQAIFFRKYVLAPGLKLLVVMALVFGNASVTFLAVGYLGAGLLGVSIFSVVLWRVLREQGLIQLFSRHTLHLPAREVLMFTVPLLASDLVYVVMNTVDAILLERTGGTVDVAAFRAVQPAARLNQMVLASFALLFTPAAARMFARQDKQGINDLYWQNAAWVAIASFPIFAVTFSLARPLTLFVFQERYADSAIIMALLSLGYYFNAATGQNGLTLKVLGKLRYIVSVDILAAVINLALNLVLIPRYGALGAAVGTMTTLIIFNILKQLGLMLGTNIRVFDFHYIRVYLSIIAGSVGLLVLQAVASPHFIIGFVAAALVSLVVLRVNRGVLNVGAMFPELLRIPGMRWLLGG